jgi:uncharacterized repeat protein (TIGR01451 family)
VLGLTGSAVSAWAGTLPGWTYKIPVTITNPGTAVTDYQVRIDLSTANFNFAQAKTDGSDIRFTATDGTTLLPYWTEGWVAGTSGTFWVRLSSIPAGGSTTIYLYSGNPSATSASTGSGTFIFFEDFETTPWTAWTKEVAGIGTFTQSADYVMRGARSGKFDQPTGAGSSTVFSKASSLPGDNFTQEWNFYDDMDQTAFKMVRANYQISGGQIGLGVWTGNSTTRYSLHNTSYGYTATTTNRAIGWHKMGITVSGGAANFFVDGSTSLGTLTGLPSTFNRVSVEGIPDGPTTYYVDDFRVRKYISQTLTVAIGQAGQPAPDMAIAMTDSPDPVRVGQQLTYSITVNNYGDQDATNVTVTDVLPANVTYVSAVSSQGGCSGTSTITASLGGVASGASATVTIVVTTTAQGQLSNTASVTCAETDPNPANNSVTATTTVGNPVVYIVNSVDTEAFNDHPMGTLHTGFDLRNFVPATTVYIGPLMASSFRNNNRDTFGTPFKMTWFVEMDNFINNGINSADGSALNYLSLYTTFKSNYGTDLAAWGDELANHHHFMTWNGSSWVMMTDGTQLGTTYDEHNNALDRMVLDGGFFPTDFRSGWLWESNQLQAWEEQWLLGDFGWGSSYNSYHPSASDYNQVGSMNHWITGSDGSGPNSTSLTAAFAKAASTGKPVIYNWYCHDRENMSSFITSLQSMATAAQTSSGVPFRYATGKEALQALMSSTDATPPTLAVTQGGGSTFNISSNEAVWNNKPYAAARYVAPSGLRYLHTAPTSSGTNNWTVPFDDQRSYSSTTPGELYTLVGATANGSESGNPASYAIDGIEGTYWASPDLPGVITVDAGTVQSVPRMTIHFYDQDARTYTYYVEASTDGSNWTQIAGSTTVHGTGTHDFSPAVSMRYARVTVTGASANTHAHIYEIKLYKTLPTTTSEVAYLQSVGTGAGDLAGNTSVGTTVVRALADVALSMTAPASSSLGSDLTYNLKVTNNGPSAASGVQVTDVLPGNASFVSASPGGSYNSGAGTVVFDLGGLASGASTPLTVTVHPAVQGTYLSTASVTSSSADANQANNSASASTSVVPSPADVALAMTAPASLIIGNDLTYSLAVTNHGPSAASGIQVTDVLPAGANFKSASAGTYDGGTRTLLADLGGLGSGGTATLTIVVTPTAEGTYANTASVASSSATTDPNLTNNTASVSTLVGNPVVYVVNAVDTEPFDDHAMTPQHRPFDLHNFIKGQSPYIEPLMASSFRNGNVDSYGTPFKMTWYMEMDNYLNNGVYADGSSMTYLTLYNTFKSNFGTELATWGDEMAYHHHFMTWNGSTWVQMTDGSQLGTTYDEHNNALDRMVLDAGFFPTDFRSGWLWESSQLQTWVENWLLADFGTGSGQPAHSGGPNHWNYNCDGTPSQPNINAAFAQALSTGQPVVYGWYCHDRENMGGNITALQSYLTAARGSTGVPFRYATSKEAIQAVMKTPDKTPPVLTVTPDGAGTFNIASNEPVWNSKPYVAARYLGPDALAYEHDAAVATGTNSWAVTLPDQKTITAVIPAAKYPIVGVTASSAKPDNPASYAIDGNETTYWDSYAVPQWISVDLGSIQPVPRLTVHFYDGDARTYTYSIDASADGTNWTEIVASTTVHGLATHDFSPAINLRYARVTVTAQQGANNFAHIFEINLYQTLGGTTQEIAYLQEVGVGAGDLSGNTAVGRSVVRALADVALNMTAPASSILGSDLTYSLTVTNNGPSSALGVQVIDVLPAGVTFVSSTPAGSYNGLTRTVVVSLGDLTNGATAPVSIVVHPTAEGTYVNTASATSPSNDPKLTNNSATVSTAVLRSPADLMLAMTAPGSVKVGSDLTYSLTVTNNGPSAASGVQVTDVLPAGLSFVSATASQGTCTGTSTVVADLGGLASGATATVTIKVYPTAEGTYVNPASVTSSSATTDPNLTNNSASVTTYVGNPLVFVVIAIDTEADNNHPMGSLHTTFDVHNYQRTTSGCTSFQTDYSENGSTWNAYGDGTTFNFKVTPSGGTDPATSYTCGSNNAYGLDDYARAVRFTVPNSGNYDVGLQLSVTGSPPATNIYVVPDLGGSPNVASPIATYTATVGGFTSGSYVVIGSGLSLTAGTNYWWVAARQSSGNDSNQFAVYQGSPSGGGSNTFSQIMDPAFRGTTTDSDGRSFRMTWYMEMDNFINNGLYADGTPMNYLTLYYELMNHWGTEVHGYGDEIAYHHHFMTWNGTSWVPDGHQHAIDGYYEEHNKALDRMVLDAGFFPTDFRAGWLNNDNQLQAWVERWLLSDDGGGGWATGWRPYHPSATDYTQEGDMKHWIMNGPGGPSQGSIDGAFAQAIAESRPVVSCWYMHERDDMRGMVAAAHTYLQTAAAANPGVPFKYVTAQEAMRAIIGTTDITPPTLSIAAAGGGAYTITSSEALWGSGPYVAGRYGSGSGAVYAHFDASPSGSNRWTATLPSSSGGQQLALVGTGALDMSGNSATTNFPVGSGNVVAAVVPGGACISTAHSCVAIPVNFTRADATPVRAYSVVVHLSPELAACGAKITQGTYLSTLGSTSFNVVDRGGGVYQVDEALLGAGCGPTGNGTLFTLSLGSTAASGSGTVALDSVRVRGCDNGALPGDAGPAASVPIDNTAPAALAGLTASLGSVGSDRDGRISVAISFAPPTDGSQVAVYRKGYGDHPVYGSGGAPAVPASPAAAVAAGWEPTGVTASGQADDPLTRDYWYYAAYTIDGCGNATASTRAGGVLNYFLGDVVDGQTECVGNNLVDMADVSLLGTHYGETRTDQKFRPCLDVGPTTDYGTRSLPTPDGILEFEDLVIFALNYGVTSAPGVLPASTAGGSRPAAASVDAVALTVPAIPNVGGTFTVAVRGAGKGDLQALSLGLEYDHAVVEMTGAEAGPLLSAQTAPAMVLSPKAGKVDIALLGKGAGITGEGELVKVSFRVLAAGDPHLRLASVDGRDAQNEKVVLGVTTVPALPTVTQLAPAQPNPFSQTATLRFSLAQAGPADLVIYSVSGRQVRVLSHGVREPGEYSVEWDGRDDGGSAVAAGVYYVRLTTAQGRFTRPAIYLR